MIKCYNKFLEVVHMRKAGPTNRAGSLRWDDFYLTFIWNLLN